MLDILQPREALTETIKPAKASKTKAERVKRVVDPRLAIAARELRDRWLERINEAPLHAAAKYDVTRIACASLIASGGRLLIEVA